MRPPALCLSFNAYIAQCDHPSLYCIEREREGEGEKRREENCNDRVSPLASKQERREGRKTAATQEEKTTTGARAFLVHIHN